MSQKSLERYAHAHIESNPSLTTGTIIIGRTHDGRVDIEGHSDVGDAFKKTYCEQSLPEGFELKPISISEIANEHEEELIKHDIGLVKAIQICQKHGSAIMLVRPDSIDYIAPNIMTLDERFDFYREAQMSTYAETLMFAKYPYSKVVETLNEPVWKPLELHIGEDLCQEFMYMHGLRARTACMSI